MVDVTTTMMINCPCDKVAAYAANPDNSPEWYVNIQSAEWRTAKPLAIGAEVAFKAHFLGKELAYVYRITEYEPGKRLVMSTADGPFPMETTYIWESAGDNVTRMTLRNRGNPSGFSALVSPLMAFMMRRANRKDLIAIKRILEQKKSRP